MRVYPSLSLFVFVFLSFGGSETLIKINIIGFALHPTNGFSPRVLRFSHSSPGMFGEGSLLPFLRSDPLFFFFFFFFSLFFPLSSSVMNPYSKAQHALSLLRPPPPAPSPSISSPFSVTLLFHFSFTSHNIHYITPATRHCHASNLQSTEQTTTAQPPQKKEEEEEEEEEER